MGSLFVQGMHSGGTRDTSGEALGEGYAESLSMTLTHETAEDEEGELGWDDEEEADESASGPPTLPVTPKDDGRVVENDEESQNPTQESGEQTNPDGDSSDNWSDEDTTADHNEDDDWGEWD